jgi:hypothetical protein
VVKINTTKYKRRVKRYATNKHISINKARKELIRYNIMHRKLIKKSGKDVKIKRRR